MKHYLLSLMLFKVRSVDGSSDHDVADVAGTDPTPRVKEVWFAGCHSDMYVLCVGQASICLTFWHTAAAVAEITHG